MVPARPLPPGWHPGAPPQRWVAKGSWGVIGQRAGLGQGHTATGREDRSQCSVQPPYLSKQTLSTKDRASHVSSESENGHGCLAISLFLLPSLPSFHPLLSPFFELACSFPPSHLSNSPSPSHPNFPFRHTLINHPLQDRAGFYHWGCSRGTG